MRYSSLERGFQPGNPFASALVIIVGSLVIAASIVVGFFAFLIVGSLLLVLAAVVSAAIAGAAGGIYSHYVRIIDPDVFLFIYTVTMVIMVITGGKGTLSGPIIGGIIFGIAPDVLRELAQPEIQWIIYGALMVAIVFFLPNGIVPALGSWWSNHFGGPGTEQPPRTAE